MEERQSGAIYTFSDKHSLLTSTQKHANGRSETSLPFGPICRHGVAQSLEMFPSCTEPASPLDVFTAACHMTVHQLHTLLIYNVLLRYSPVYDSSGGTASRYRLEGPVFETR
jgi:hypothetical protein